MVLTWRDGYVPYVLDKKIAEFENYVISAMREIMYVTRCIIQFVPRNCERDYIFITEGERCSSFVGRCSYGKQELCLDTNNLKRQIILHELCHALGLYHEHQRSMRDDYIKIHFDNIEEEHRVHFIKMIPEDDIEGLDFDYFSIMLYGNTSFVKDHQKGLKSITAIKEDRYLPITERKNGLSKGDIQKLHHLYTKKQGQSEMLATRFDFQQNGNRFAYPEHQIPMWHGTPEKNRETYNRSYSDRRQTYPRCNYQDNLWPTGQDNYNRRQFNSHNNYQRTPGNPRAKLEFDPSMNRVDNHRNTARSQNTAGQESHPRKETISSSFEKTIEKKLVSAENDEFSCNTAEIASDEETKQKPSLTNKSQEENDNQPSPVCSETEKSEDYLLSSETNTEPSAPALEEEEVNQEHETQLTTPDS